MEILPAISGVFGVLSLLFMRFTYTAARRKRWMGTASRTGGAALFLSLSALAATLAVSTQGYRALTGEELALTVTVTPTGDQQFNARAVFPDGRDTTLVVLGDQLMVDAHILKWHYWANVIGLTTEYELDRLQGRYISLEDEQGRERSIHALGTEKPLDLFELVQRHTFLSPLVDTEYGSATYIDVSVPGRFEVLVSTTGLLIRDVGLARGRDQRP